MERPELFSRWDHFCSELGAGRARVVFYEELCSAYSQAGRFYHTLDHIAACLSELDTCRPLALHPLELEMAVWYHDFIHAVGGEDDEERSAYIAYERSRQMGLPPPFASRARDYVLATQHFAGTKYLGIDSRLIIDIDLAILGKPEEEFRGYEHRIEEEYLPFASSHSEFNARRIRVMHHFLDRDRIYTTDHFSHRYEEQARKNMMQSVERLEAAR